MATPVITNIDNVNHTYQADGQQYSINPATGRYALTSSLSQPAPSTVSSASIQPANQVTIPPSPAADPLASMYQTQQQISQSADMDETNAKNDYKSLLASISGLQDQDANRSSDQINAENEQGIPGIAKNINDLEATARQTKLAYDMTPYSLQGQGRGISTGILRGQEAVKQRQVAIDNLVANSDLEAARGNLTLAQTLADRAVAAKYDPIEKKLQNQKEMLQSYQYLLTGAQQKAATAKTNLINLQLKQLEDKKAQEDGINNVRLAIAKNGGDPSIIKNATTVGEALDMAGKSLTEHGYQYVKNDDGSAVIFDSKTGTFKTLGGIKPTGTGGGGSVNSQYSGIISTILGSGKFTKDQSAAITRAIQSGEDPATVIKNNAKNIMGQTEGNKVTNFEVARDTMNDISSALSQYYAAGGKTSLLTGNYESVLAKLGTVNDPKLRSLATQIAAGLQIYRNAVSGTAYSVQEGAQIQAIFPGIDNSKGLNDAIIQGRKAAFDSVIDNSYRAVLGKGYDQLKSTSSNTSKGTLDDRSFVAKAVQAQSLPYDTIVNNTPKGQIPVVDNKTGQVGYLPIEEYNSVSYTKM
jgi:hypothetical protein